MELKKSVLILQAQWSMLQTANSIFQRPLHLKTLMGSISHHGWVQVIAGHGSSSFWEMGTAEKTSLLTQLSSASSDHFLPCPYASQNSFFKFGSHVFWLFERQTVHSFKHFLALQVSKETMREDSFNLGYFLSISNSKLSFLSKDIGQERNTGLVASEIIHSDKHCHGKFSSCWE